MLNIFYFFAGRGLVLLLLFIVGFFNYGLNSSVEIETLALIVHATAATLFHESSQIRSWISAAQGGTLITMLHRIITRDSNVQVQLIEWLRAGLLFLWQGRQVNALRVIGHVDSDGLLDGQLATASERRRATLLARAGRLAVQLYVSDGVQTTAVLGQMFLVRFAFFIVV